MSVEDDRSLSLRNVVNARDLGGLPLNGGGKTRRGVLLRSDAPYRGDLAPDGVRWPPDTVIDLREADEGDSTRARWPLGTAVVSTPVFSGARVDHLVEAPLDRLYATMLDTAGSRITRALNAFDVTGTTLVHCAAGKDRTGVVIAIALLLCDVEQDAIVADYRRTEDAISKVYERMRERGNLKHDIPFGNPVFRSPASAITRVIERVAAHRGGPERWFAEHGGNLDHMFRWRASFVFEEHTGRG